MAAVSIRVGSGGIDPRLVVPRQSTRRRRFNRNAVLQQIGGKERRFVFPYAPLEVSLERRTIQYNEVERPGRRPLLEAKQYQLRQVSFETVLVDEENPIEMDINEQIALLTAISREDTDLRFSYDSTVKSITWRISDLTFDIVRRNVYHRPTVAGVRITLTESSKLLNKLIPGMKRIIIKFEPITTGNSEGDGSGNSPSGNTINGKDDPSYTEDREPD